MQFLRLFRSVDHIALLPLGIISGSLFACLIILSLSPRAQAIDIPTSLTVSICGDAIINVGEVCDFGPSGNTGAYGSSTAERTCSADCLTESPYCGDGILQARFSEQCDDGNNTSGDLCSASCQAEEADVPSGGGGSGTPARGPVAPQGGVTGQIPGERQTRVVVRGKAFPNAQINILIDGQAEGTVNADANADFVYSTSNVTPGTATFGFWAVDQNGIESITTSAVFEVVQSAVTTVANVFIPPSIGLSEKQVSPGDLLTVSGQTVPAAKVTTEYDDGTVTLAADADTGGAWALQIDTGSLEEGFHTVKAFFELTQTIKSGHGKSVSFYVGEGTPLEAGSADINGDGKVNLVDFSIFLLAWGSDDIRSDFNSDGAVNLADFSIMLFNWTG